MAEETNITTTPGGAAEKGSQYWIQRLVKLHPTVLADAIGVGPIQWVSPLADDYLEYRDQEFLDRLDLKLTRRSLKDFWPARGPRWDALGRANRGDLILVEAKAHIAELLTPPSRASTESLIKIRAALTETANALGAVQGCDWTTRFYQVTNRLAHGYLLSVLNQISTRLVFLYIVGDKVMNGPQTVREWKSALLVMEEALGLRARMPSFVTEAFVDVSGATPVAVRSASHVSLS